MQTYTCHLIGEDHTFFTRCVEAESHDDAYEKIETIYPEAKVEGLYSPDDLREIELRRYRAIEAAMDNPDLDDFGY